MSSSKLALSVKEREEGRILASARANLYDVLGVSCEASESEIKLAYRKLALRFHPDKNTSASTPSAEKAFKVISLASTCLSDPLSREQYDMIGSSCSYEDQAVAYSRSTLVEFCKDIVVSASASASASTNADGKAPAPDRSTSTRSGEADSKTALEGLLLLYLQELAAADADSNQEYRAALAVLWSPPEPPSPSPSTTVSVSPSASASHVSTAEAVLGADSKSDTGPGPTAPLTSASLSSSAHVTQTQTEAEAEAQGLRRDSAVGKLLKDQKRTGVIMAILTVGIVLVFFWSESYYYHRHARTSGRG
jgi:curved DNA-binding protein CbpA